MKILVIGSGAREHALCYLISKSSLVSSIYAIPGNYGISQLAECEQIDQTDFEKIYDFCKSKMIELVIVGPEVPLVAGIVDFFRETEIKIFGPDKYASQLEGSKGFMKDLCKQNRIPTADYARFDNKEEAINYLNAQPLPIVIKADGLAAGKGVTVADTKKMAEQAINDIFDEKFGANMDVVIEEFMDGEEASYFVCCDGEDFVSLESAQDHKRIGENDTIKIEDLLKKGESLVRGARIKLATIHGVKGNEKQNVVLPLCLPKASLDAYEKDPTDEHRLMYVGATRAKESLHIIYPKRGGYEI